MKIRSISPDSFASNCYLVVEGERALVVDPGVSVRAIQAALDAEGARCCGILLTHGHFDHVLSLDELRNAYPDATVYLHAADAELLADGDKNAFKTFFGRDRVFIPAEKTLRHGDKIQIGEESLTVLNTPGHTDGCICLLGDGILFTGDTLFADTIGRCDLYSGSPRKMRDTLSYLRTLDPKLKIYPGHGDEGRLGHALDIVSYYF